MIVAFRTFDPEHKGFVTANEFRKIMGKLGAAPLPSLTVDEMVSYAGAWRAFLAEILARSMFQSPAASAAPFFRIYRRRRLIAPSCMIFLS